MIPLAIPPLPDERLRAPLQQAIDQKTKPLGALGQLEAVALHSGRIWRFSHVSQEQGHRAVLDHLEVKPLLALDLCLGEGTGAALAYLLVQGAAILSDMATFAPAGVTQK